MYVLAWKSFNYCHINLSTNVSNFISWTMFLDDFFVLLRRETPFLIDLEIVKSLNFLSLSIDVVPVIE